MEFIENKWIPNGDGCMRIICEQCQTKYIVPDDKIVKNVFRLTCQKCGHVITTRVEETSPSERSTLGKWRETSLNTPKRMTVDKAGWYYSYNGESFGPYTEIELKEKLLSAKLRPIADQCYVWNRALPEWQPAAETEPFASAILTPPAPPAAAPASKNRNDHLPPLFSDSSEKVPVLNPFRSNSPDVKSLKQRLHAAPKSGEKPTVSMYSDDLLDGMNRVHKQRTKDPQTVTMHSDELMLGLSRMGKPQNRGFAAPRRQDDIPTHQAFPAVDDRSNPDMEEAEDCTKVGASPLLSFQSLDAISSEIRVETKSGGSQPMERQLPTLSKLPTIGKKTGDNAASNKVPTVSKPAFSASDKQIPGISSLFDKPASKPNSENTGKSLGIPKFGGLKDLHTPDAHKSETPNTSANPMLNASDVLFKNNTPSPVKDEANEVAQQTESAPSPEAISVEMSEIGDQPGGLENREISVELPDVDLDNDIPMLKSIDNKPDKSSGRTISRLGLPELPEAKTSETNDAPTAVRGNILLDAALNPESFEPPFDTGKAEIDDALKIVSPSEMLGLVSKPLNPDSSNRAASGNVPDSPELQEIDLAVDMSDDGISASDHAKASESEQPDPSDVIISDAVIMDEPVTDSKASDGDSHSDHASAESKDLFADVDQKLAENPGDGEHISENSTLIQLEHFQKQQSKHSRKWIILVASVVLVIAVIVFVFTQGSGDNSNETAVAPEVTPVSSVGSFADVTGRAVTSDELDDSLIPRDEFEIVGVAPSPAANSDAKASSRTARSRNTGSGNAADSAEPIKPSEVKTDGRANVVLKKQESFASTEGVSGAKYQINPGGAPSADTFSAGLRSVSKTVQECYQRVIMKSGNLNVQKIYIRITVEPSGKVNHFEVENKSLPDTFGKCLESKKAKWEFAPFSGSAVKLRQGFIIDG